MKQRKENGFWLFKSHYRGRVRVSAELHGTKHGGAFEIFSSFCQISYVFRHSVQPHVLLPCHIFVCFVS